MNSQTQKVKTSNGLAVMDIVAIVFLIQFILVVIFCFVLLMTAILTISIDLLLYSFSYISKFNI